MSCAMFLSTLLCDILLTLILIRHKLDLQKIPMKPDEEGIQPPLTLFAIPLTNHFENRMKVNLCTRRLSFRYLLILSLWLFISILFVVGHWINYLHSSYREEGIINHFLFTYIWVTVIFVIFVFLPLGVFLMIGLYWNDRKRPLNYYTTSWGLICKKLNVKGPLNIAEYATIQKIRAENLQPLYVE